MFHDVTTDVLKTGLVYGLSYQLSPLYRRADELICLGLGTAEVVVIIVITIANVVITLVGRTFL